jgi:hypothetical protein
MVHAHRDVLLGRIREERLQVAAPGLQGLVLRRRDVVDAEVELAPAGHVARHLFAHERVG